MAFQERTYSCEAPCVFLSDAQGHSIALQLRISDGLANYRSQLLSVDGTCCNFLVQEHLGVYKNHGPYERPQRVRLPLDYKNIHRRDRQSTETATLSRSIMKAA